MLQEGKVNFLIDLSFGSTGKGNVAAYIGSNCELDLCIANHGANAGHQHFYTKEKKITTKLLPVAGLYYEPSNMLLGSGTIVDMDVLKEEINEYDVKSRLLISAYAPVVNDYCKGYEREHLKYISSTFKGIGAALGLKAMRSKDIKLVMHYPELERYCHYHIADIIINRISKFKHTALCEIPQGVGLSVDSELYPYCFYKKARILLAGGMSITIKEIVDKKMNVKVLSVNKHTGAMEEKQVVNWFKNEYKNPKWVRVCTTKAPFGLTCVTPTHKYYTQRGEVEARDLINGDKLYTGELDIIGTKAEQVVLGSLLGDGCIHYGGGKSNPQLSITHCYKQKGYLTFKVGLLKKFVGGNVRTLPKPSGFGSKNMQRYCSARKVQLIDYFNFKYPRLDVETLVSKLDLFGLAIWYQDDGRLKKTKLSGTKNIYWKVFLHTNGFGVDEVKNLILAIKKKFGLDFKLYMIRDRGKRYPVMRLSLKDSNKFFNMVAKHIHPCMQYKLPEKYRGQFVNQCDCGELLTPLTINCLGVINGSKRDEGRYKVRYNIEVEGNHNYFVGNQYGYTLVGNCTSRPVNVGQALAYLDIPPSLVGDTIGVVRTYPIRVGSVKGGYSGDSHFDSKEIGWDELSNKLGRNIIEYTSVTKRVRRLFSFSKYLFEMAVRRNDINILFISFWDYLLEKEKNEMLDYVTGKKFDFKEIYVVDGPDHRTNIHKII